MAILDRVHFHCVLSIILATFLWAGCQLVDSDSDSESLVGPYPTAVHDAVKEFNATIPQDPQFAIPQIKHVKLMTRKFDHETREKVFLDLHYQVLYQNDSYLFCGLIYSWHKTTKLVLLEEEKPCDKQGDIPDLGAPAGEAPKKEPVKSYQPNDDETAKAVEEVERYFIEVTPSAEVSGVTYVGQTSTYGEVEVEYKQTDAGETMLCTSLYGYDFVKPNTFLIEKGECNPI
jgi:hypothetical protein